MDGDRQKTTFPRINASRWWALRDKFKTSIPRGVVDDTYLATVLGGMSAESARSNVKPPLRIMGLIDKDGAPTELAHQWRLDDQYPAVCKQILQSVYPDGLLDAVPVENPSVDAAKSWFMNVARVGEAAAVGMARTYVMLCEADITKRSEPKAAATRNNSRRVSPGPRVNNQVVTSSHGTSQNSETEVGPKGHPPAGEGIAAPSLHIDV